MANERVYYNAFNQVPEIGSVRLNRILNYFPDLESAWKAPSSELSKAGLSDRIINQLLETKKRINPEEEFEKLADLQISLLIPTDELYPQLLKEIPHPPMTLYVKGSILSNDQMAVAVVGTRKVTPYGKRSTEDLVRDLVRANITIISGLALGADAVAHRAAVDYGGRTIGVLACGLDSVYPASNRLLAEKILNQNGALISELPLGTPPLRHHFPNRNRIISGLALGTVVVEAASESGALITARHALEQNRQVFAIPGSIYSEVSEGPHNLIKMGAKLAVTAQDILEDLNLGFLQEQLVTQKIIGDTKEEQTVLDQLSREPRHVDMITKNTDLKAGKVASTLTILEMKGKVKNVGAHQYVISR